MFYTLLEIMWCWFIYNGSGIYIIFDFWYYDAGEDFWESLGLQGDET